MRNAVTMVCILLLAGLALAQRPPGWDGQVSPEDEILYGRPTQEVLCTNPAGTASIPQGQEREGWFAGKMPDQATWSWGPLWTTNYTRFDGEYFPGTNKVYFLGGRVADGSTNGEVWCYDPATRTYSDMSVALQTPISNYDVVYLRDNYSATDTFGLYVFGGRDNSGVMIPGVQVYYPRSNTVRTVSSDPYPDSVGGYTCMPGGAVGCGNKAYTYGGLHTSYSPYATSHSFVYDPLASAGRRWTRLGDLGLARGYMIGAVVDSFVYACGGDTYDGAALYAKAQCWKLNTLNTSSGWSAIANMPDINGEARAVGFNVGSPYTADGVPVAQKFIVCGRGIWASEDSACYIYNTTNNTWSQFPKLNFSRRNHAVALIPGSGTSNGVPGLWVWGGRHTSDAWLTDSSEFFQLIIPVASDVGVTQITAPAGLFCTCDTMWPKAKVKNWGSSNQADIPVRYVIWDGSNKVYDQTIHVSVNAGTTVEAAWTTPCMPIGHDANLIDSAWTELSTDVNHANDSASSSFNVNAMADVTMSYNDGTTGSNGCYVWLAANFTNAVRFDGPCPVGKFAIGLSGYSSDPGGPYPCTCKVRLNDGDNDMPGTEVWVSPMMLYSAGYPNDYINYVVLDPPAVVTSDSFFVTWKPQAVANPFPSFDWDGPYDIGDDFGTMPGSETFGPFACGGESDANGDLIMNAYYSGYLHDVGVGSIDVPPAVIDSNTTFTPSVTFKNAGLKDRPGSAVAFWITDTGGNKVSTGSGNVGALTAGASETMTFPPELTPLPTDYMDSAVITCSSHDANRANDTLAQALFVRYYDVMTQIVRPMVYEVPGLVPVTVRLTNKGNVPAVADSVKVTISDGYNSFVTGVPLTPGQSQLVFMPVPWVCPAGVSVTATAWITIPPDMYHPNDTATITVKSGIPGWAEKTPMPATPTGKAIKDGGCMAYDAGTALIYASKGNKTGDFYTYDAASTPPLWTNKTGIPLGAEGKQVYKGSVICSDGNGNLYLTKGNNTIGFWKYEAVENEWTQMTNVPLGSSNKKVKQGAGLAWATKVGTGAVYLLKGYRNEFHKYDPATNTWKQLLDAPIGAANHVKWDAGSWLVADADAGNKLYAFKGKYHEFYTYDTDADTWSHALTPMPIPGNAGNKKAKDGSCAAWYGGKIYAFKGGNTTEFWRYFPQADTWNKQFDIPLIGMTGARKKVKAGAALAPYPGLGVYAFKGNKSLEFWNYVPFEVAGAQPTRDGITAVNTQLGVLSFAIAPNPLAGGLATVRYNLPKAGLATLNVFDVTGRTVLTQTLAAGRTGTAGLDLRKLEAGVYLVKVTTEGFSTTQKLVVEH